MKNLDFVLLIVCICFAGCAGWFKGSATDLVTPYGTANSINAEGGFNGQLPND